MKEALKTAVIGCGKVGHFHARAWRQVEGCELVACWNRALPRAQAFALDYGIRPYDDLERMVRECGVQAASICTPHMNHAGLAAALAKLGVHIIVEKPLAVSLEDCDAIIAAVRESGVTGATISQRRFYEPVIRVKRAIDEGKIGKPILGTVNMLGWRSMDYYRSDPWRGSWAMEGGGVLVNQAPHQLDLWQWMCGVPRSVFAKAQYGFRRDIVVEDEVNALVDFGDGATGTFITCVHDIDGTDRLEILCDKGKIVVDASNTVKITRLKDDEEVMSKNMGMDAVAKLFTGQLDRSELMSEETKEYGNVWGAQHCEVMRNFAAAIHGEEELLAPGADGIHGVRLANAIHLSSWTGQEVSIEDFDEDAYLAQLNERISAEGKFETRS